MHHFRPQAQLELLEATQWYLTDGGPAVAEQFEWAVQRALRMKLVSHIVSTIHSVDW